MVPQSNRVSRPGQKKPYLLYKPFSYFLSSSSPIFPTKKLRTTSNLFRHHINGSTFYNANANNTMKIKKRQAYVSKREHHIRGFMLHVDGTHPTIALYGNIVLGSRLIIFQSTPLQYLNRNCKKIHILQRFYNCKCQQHNANNKNIYMYKYLKTAHHTGGSKLHIDHIQPFHQRGTTTKNKVIRI